MAQKSTQVSGKKAKLKPVPKITAKAASKVTNKTKATAKPTLFEKAKSLIERATSKSTTAKKPVTVAAPSPKVSKKLVNPEIEKARTALVKEAKVADTAPAKTAASKPGPVKSAKSMKTPPVKPGPAPVKGAALVQTVVPSEPAKVAKAPKVPKEKKSRKISIAISANEAASALSAKWSSLYKKAEQIEAKPYNMKQTFEEKTAVVHKILGWGYILANRNDRLEVLFKDGIKYLISNYQP